MTKNQIHKDYSASANLISTTDPKSYITYANDDFCDIAGYSREELLGNPHNMVRHADMPKQAFKQLWEYLKQGQSWMGLVKNQCKNSGEHYWVSAFATPIKNESGEIIEYQSVRSQATQEQIKRAESLYSKMRNNQRINTMRLPFHKLSIAFGVLLTTLATVTSITSPSYLSFALLAVSLTSTIFALLQNKRFEAWKSRAQEAYVNPLMEQIYTGKFDDFSQIELALMKRKSELRAVAGRATDTASAIHSAAEEELSNSVEIEQSLNKQCQETEQVAAAVEELTHSISEVASASSVASNLANEADTQAVKGMESINSTISEVDDLVEELGQAQSIVNQLSQDSQKIDSILEVITAISEQTNLLALNAAIEAARAGDAGRGFAVVADEVRDLASKTADSANEIHTMIKQFKETSQSAVVAMDQGMSLSDNCKVRAHETGEVLAAISEILNRVADSSVQIASAVEQQATVTQEVNQNVSNIKTLADDTSLASKTSLDRTTELVEQLEGLERLMKQFQS